MNTAPISPVNLKIEAEDDVFELYEFGTKTAKQHFCKRCGIYTLIQTRSQAGFYRINISSIEGIDPFTLGRIFLTVKICSDYSDSISLISACAFWCQYASGKFCLINLCNASLASMLRP
tara:strand:+ start:210 stop:566 length:357 start_codon:yes stop_codon:yes gene_type:complete